MNIKALAPSAIALTLSLLLTGPTSVQAQAIFHGAGSSAAANIYKTWAAEFAKSGGAELDYVANGSSAGQKAIAANTVEFGASDVAPSDADLKKQNLLLIPIAVTGITPVVNITHVGNGQLKLTGEVLAQIYSGEIKRWNAPAITALNPKLGLPDAPINVIVRGDGSGTTYNFTDYLSRVSPSWKTTYGAKFIIGWPSGFTAVNGSGGVVKAIKETTGSIGYVDYSYAKENKFATVSIKNASDEFVQPGIPAFKAALSASDWVSTGDFHAMLTNLPGKQSWPITMGTFALVRKTTDKPEPTKLALKYFVWSFMHGDNLVQLSSYVALPDRVQAAAFKSISSVTDMAGKPIGLNLF